MRNEHSGAPLPYESKTAGNALVITGTILAAIGALVIAVELFNSAVTAPIALGACGVVFGLLLMVVGYVKKAAIAAEESYLLQARIYEERRNITAS